MTSYDKILQNSTFHGFPELVTSRHRLTKVFWSIILVISMGILAWEIYKVSYEYQATPFSTKFSYVQTEHFQLPSMMVCPRTWLNKTAVGQANISPKILEDILSVTIPQKQEDFLEKTSSVDMRKLSQVFMRLASDLQIPSPVWLNMFKYFALEGPKLISYVTTRSLGIDLHHFDNPVEDVQPVFDVFEGLCYAVTFKPIQRVSLSGSLVVALKINYLDEVMNIFPGPPDVTIALDYSEKSCAPNTVYHPIGFGKSHGIILDRTNFIYLSTKQHPCSMKTSIHDKRRCNINCLSQEYTKLNCTFLKTLSCGVVNPNFLACTPQQIKYIAENRQELEKCRKKCDQMDPCNEFLWTLTLNSVPIRTDGTLLRETYLALTIEKPFAYKESREFVAYSWDTLLSNIGGQLGLWLGASLLSICQLISSCIDAMVTANCTSDESKKRGNSPLPNDISRMTNDQADL